MNKFFELTFKFLLFLLIIALLPKDFLFALKTKLDSLGVVKIFKDGLDNFLAFINQNFSLDLKSILNSIFGYLEKVLK